VLREPGDEGDPVDLVAVAVLGDQRRMVLHRAAEAVGDPGGDRLPEFVRRELDVRAGVALGVDLGDKRLAIPVGLLAGNVGFGDFDGFGGLGGRRLAAVGPHLDGAGEVAAGDPPTAVTDSLREAHGDDQLFFEDPVANDARERTVHPDRRRVDLFGFDAPLDVLGGDVDRERLAHLVDGDVGVVVRADVEPAVAALHRPAARAERHLQPLGGVDEFERLEVAVVTERRVVLVWRSRLGLARGDRLATARTELA